MSGAAKDLIGRLLVRADDVRKRLDRLPVCLPACLSACLPACLPACLVVYLCLTFSTAPQLLSVLQRLTAFKVLSHPWVRAEAPAIALKTPAIFRDK